MSAKIIFEGFGYTASQHKFGLIVTGRKGGKCLHYPAAIEWIDAIQTAIDDTERAALCKAVYNA